MYIDISVERATFEIRTIHVVDRNYGVLRNVNNVTIAVIRPKT